MAEVDWEEACKILTRELAMQSMLCSQIKVQLEAALEVIGALPPDDMTRVRMRTAREVQRAHDILAELMTNPGLRQKLFPEEDMLWARWTAHCLCWILNHQHENAFAHNLEYVETVMADHGIVIKSLGKLTYPDEGTIQ
jgi:hypothetical protein